MINKYEGIFSKPNVDSQGNLVLQEINNENHTIYRNMIQLKQNPDKYRRVRINGLKEVFNGNELLENEFKVDYAFGIIYFHSSKEGKDINVNRYYGTGVTLISDTRIITKYNKDGSILETLDKQLVEFGSAMSDKFLLIDGEWISKKAIVDKFLTNSEGRMEIINREHQGNIDNVQNAIYNVNNNFKLKYGKYTADASVDTFIIPFFNEVVDNIEMYFDGNYLPYGEKYRIVGSTVTLIGWNLTKGQTIHYQILRSGQIPQVDTNNTISREMLASDVQNDLLLCRGKSVVIEANQWQSVDGLYSLTFTHNLNARDIKRITMYGFDDNMELFIASQILDENNIKITTDENIKCKLIVG